MMQVRMGWILIALAACVHAGPSLQDLFRWGEYDSLLPVTVEGTVDTDIPGYYYLSYHCKDSSFNSSILLNRSVRVLEPQ